MSIVPLIVGSWALFSGHESPDPFSPNRSEALTQLRDDVIRMQTDYEIMLCNGLVMIHLEDMYRAIDVENRQ
jgi:hypothetical protein